MAFLLGGLLMTAGHLGIREKMTGGNTKFVCVYTWQKIYEK